MKISYSAIETFKQCPQKYKFQEIDKIKTPKSKEAIFGTLIHSALKFMHAKEPIFPAKEELLNFYRDNWPAGDKIKWTDEYEEKIYKQQGVEILSRYYDRLDKSRVRVIDLESSFNILIKNEDANETHILRGKIDRIDKLDDGVFEIIDYKTNRSLPSQDSVDNNIQLSIYHLALLSRWPALNPGEVRLSLYFLKHSEKLSTKRTREQLEETKKEILKVISEIKESRFPANPSPLCDFCGYRPLCPMWKHEYQAKENPAGEEAIKEAAREYLSLKERAQKDAKRIEELKQIINEYCEARNIERVFGDGGYITRKIQKRYAYEIQKIKEILEPLNLWNEVIDIQGAKLSKITKALPEETQKQIENAKTVESEYAVLTVSKK